MKNEKGDLWNIISLLKRVIYCSFITIVIIVSLFVLHLSRHSEDVVSAIDTTGVYNLVNSDNGDIIATDLTPEDIEKIMKLIVDSGVSSNNLDYLYKLIDVYKDIENIEYWNMKEDNMRFRDYKKSFEGDLHSGSTIIDTSDKNSLMCLETMLSGVVDFVKMLKNEVTTQEEMDLIHKYIRKLNEM